MVAKFRNINAPSNLAVSTPAAPAKLVQLAEPSDTEKARMRRLVDARKAYAGDWTGKKALKVEKDEPDDNTEVNRCGPIVDKDVSWLANQKIRLEVKEADGSTDAPSAAMDYLMSALGCTENNMDAFLVLMTNIVQAGGISGHPFVKLIPGSGGKMPRTIVLDNANVWVDVDPEDYNLAQAFNIQYDWFNVREQRMYQKRQIIRRVDPDDDDGTIDDYGPDTAWIITTYQRLKPQDKWSLARQNGAGWTLSAPTPDAPNPEAWNHTWPPIHACKNLPSECNYYGAPSVTPDLIHLNTVLNRLLSYCTKICRLFGHPWVWAAGLDAKELQTGPGHIICLPGIGQTLEVAEAHGNLAEMMALVVSIMVSMDELSRTPAVALGRMTELPRGQVSGSTVSLLLQPRVEKSQHQRRLYGPMLTALCEHILELGGFPALHVLIKWPNLLPNDDLALGQLAMTLSQADIMSLHSILELIGQDYDTERALQQQEAKDKEKDNPTPLLPAPGDPNSPNIAPNAGNGGNPPPVFHPAANAARTNLTAVMSK